jgi:tetratricopeptide (TPR) repeat protein
VTDDSPYDRGLKLLARGDLAGAAAAFETVIARDSTHAGAWFSMGEALHRQGDEAAARSCYERAGEVGSADAQRAEAWYRRGVSLVNSHALISAPQKDCPGAYADARRSLEYAALLGHPHARAVGEVLVPFEELVRICHQEGLTLEPGLTPWVLGPPDALLEAAGPEPLASLLDRLSEIVAHACWPQLLQPCASHDHLDDALRRGGVQELVNFVFRTAHLRVPAIEIVEGLHICAPYIGPEGVRLVIGADVVRDPRRLQWAVLWTVPYVWSHESRFSIWPPHDPSHSVCFHLAVLVYVGLGIPMAQLSLQRGDSVSAENIAALLAIQATTRAEPALTSETAAQLGPPLDTRYEAALRQLRPKARPLQA